jgi:hypothetical protein
MDYRLIESVRSRKHDSQLRVVAPEQFLKEFSVLKPAAEAEVRAWRQIQERAE